MAKRLTGKYLEGSGDTGFSQLSGIEGRVSKGSFYTGFFAALDDLQHSLSNFLAYNPEQAEEVDQQFIKYLLQLSFSMNALIYSAFEDDPKVPECPNWCEKQLPGQDGYDFMRERIEYFKQECEKLRGGDLTSEFVIPSGNFNKLRLKTRFLEKMLWSFRDQRRDFFTEKIKDQLFMLDKQGKDLYAIHELVDTWELVRKRIAILGTFLNRLSSYFFWAMSYKLLQDGGCLEEWKSQSPALSDFIN
jgi:cob(I)alamin adenosyltransferase